MMFCMYQDEDVEEITFISCYKKSELNVVYTAPSTAFINSDIKDEVTYAVYHTPCCDDHLEDVKRNVYDQRGWVMKVELML